MRRLLPLLLVAPLALLACGEPRSSGDGGDGGGGGGGSGGSGGSGGTGGTGGGGGGFGRTRVYDLQDPTKQPASGIEVVLEDVIVTGVLEARQADDTYAPQHFFVEEPEGGAYSGIYVRNGGSSGPVAPPPVAGDVVKIIGTFTEYFDRTQLEVLSVEVTGTAPMPEPVDVLPSDVGTGAARQEEFEGVLVRLTDVAVSESPVLGNDGNDHGAFRVDVAGGTGGVIVANSFNTDHVRQSCDRFASLVGIMDYSFEQAQLLPRTDDDVTYDDGSHPAAGGDVGEKSIYEIQECARPGHPRPGSIVTIRGAVVTADGGSRFWAQDPAGGPWSGVQVRLADGAVGPAPGDVVDVTGTFEEYYDATQIDEATATPVGRGTLPAPALVTAPDIRTGSPEAEPWEGVLVEVRDVENVEDPVPGTDGQDRGDFRVAPQGDARIDAGVVVGHAFDNNYGNGRVGDRFGSIVGVLDYSFSEFRLEPRGNDDLTFPDGTHPGLQELGVVTVQRIQDAGRADYVGTDVMAELQGVVVTASSTRGFFAQAPGDPRFAGLYVRIPEGVQLQAPPEGKVVTVHGLVNEYYTRTQLDADRITVTGDGALPQPYVAAPGDVATGGPDAEAFEGVLVQVRDVANIEDPVLGTDGQDRGDFRVQVAGGQGGLIVGHMYRTSYQGTVGDTFASITGVLDFSFEECRLEPRRDADLVR